MEYFMLIYNKILNSRVFKFLPYFICNYIFKKIVYFKYSKKLSLCSNNYKITKDQIINLHKECNHQSEIKTCNYLPQLLKVIFGQKLFTFCDYGCGSLKNYYILKKKLNINYLFKDQHVIDDILEDYINEKKIKNIHKFTGTEENIDFFYFGASYQYIREIDRLLISSNIFISNYILISGIITYKNDTKEKIVVSQHNVNKENFLYFYNENYLNNIIVSKGYEKIFSEKNKSDLHINFSNFRKLNLAYKDILFKKK